MGHHWKVLASNDIDILHSIIAPNGSMAFPERDIRPGNRSGAGSGLAMRYGPYCVFDGRRPHEGCRDGQRASKAP